MPKTPTPQPPGKRPEEVPGRPQRKGPPDKVRPGEKPPPHKDPRKS